MSDEKMEIIRGLVSLIEGNYASGKWGHWTDKTQAVYDRALELMAGKRPRQPTGINDDPLRVGQEIGRLEQRVIQLESDAKRAKDDRDNLWEHIDGLMGDMRRNRKIAVLANEKSRHLRTMDDTIVFALQQLVDADGVEAQQAIMRGVHNVMETSVHEYKTIHAAALGNDDDEVPV